MFLALSFWLPGVAAAISLAVAIHEGVLDRPILFIAWFGVAALCQIRGATYSPMWATGLALLAILAIYLQIRIRLDT